MKEEVKGVKSSNEELYILHYLDKMGFHYIQEYHVSKLVGDDKSHRRVDFYLDRLGIYVEYFGMYNTTKKIRDNYDEKVKIYIKNGLPTIFLYPHELGFLDYAFHTKMLHLLRMEKFKSSSTLFNYKFTRYLALGKGYLFFSFLFWVYMLFVFFSKESGFNEGMEALMFILSFVISGYYLLRFSLNVHDYFIKDL